MISFFNNNVDKYKHMRIEEKDNKRVKDKIFFQLIDAFVTICHMCIYYISYNAVLNAHLSSTNYNRL